MHCIALKGYKNNPNLQQGKNNSFYGKKHTLKHRKYLSKILTGKINIKHGKRSNLYKQYCKDCHKLISDYRRTRCQSCAAIFRLKDPKNHPNYIDGRAKNPYPRKWNKELKQFILKRDKFICQRCGKNGTHVHHINYNKNNCTENNLITLCLICNIKVNYKRNIYPNYFKKILKKKQIKEA
jgi:hypothetical protein